MAINLENFANLEAHCFNSTYRIVAERFTEDKLYYKVIKILHSEFAGQNVCFPKRLLSEEYIHTQIVKEYNGYNAKEIARKYDYTYSWIMKLLKKHSIT